MFSFIALLVLIAVLAPGTRTAVAQTLTATATTSVSPTTVVPGGTVYLTSTGSGFDANQLVTATVSPTVAGLGPFSLQATLYNGYLSVTSYPILIPANTPYGTYSINVNVGGNYSVPNQQELYAAFVVGSSTGTAITVSPTSVVPGQPFTVSGTGFTGQGLKVTVSFPTLTSIGNQTITETQAGTFSSGYIYVPVATTGGTYTVQATENYVATSGGVARSATSVITVSGGTATSSAAVTLNPSVASVATVAPGGTLSVSGTNYAGTGLVILSSPSLGIDTSVTDSGGSFYSTLAIPLTVAPGTYILTGTESGSNRTAYATITVSSSASTAGTSIAATPSSVAPGQVVTLTGYGFTAYATVNITGVGTYSTVSSASGSISTSIVVPSTDTYGTYTITAQDLYGRVATTSLIVGTASGGITATPTSAAAGTVVAITGTGFQAGETVTFGLATSATNSAFVSGTTVSFATDAYGNFSGNYTVPVSQVAGTYVLLAYGTSSARLASTPFSVTGVAATATNTPLPTSTPIPASTAAIIPFPPQPTAAPPVTGPLATISTAATTTYFAEGYTGTAATNGKATFTQSLYLYNPGSVASNVTTTYYVTSTNNTHTTVVEHDTVAPGATTVRNVNTDVGTDKNVSSVVQASAALSPEIVISRVTTAGAALDTASDLGTSTLGQTWYLAEGYTGASLQEYLTIFNPGTSDAHTRVQYLPSNTAAPAAKAYTVPAGSQVTINVRSDYNGLVAHGSRNIGISITSDQSVAVDRSMYWGNGSGSGKYGSSIGSGISAGQSTQYFSYLPTSNGSQSFVTVLNPNGSAASATLTLRDTLGNLLTAAPASIGPGQRQTFTIPSLVAGSMGILSGTLVSSQPVVAEASVYFGGSPNVGNHPGVVMHGTAGSSTGAEADVSAAGAGLRIVNVSGAAIHVQVLGQGAGSPSTLYDGTVANRASATIQIPAGADGRSVAVVGSGAFSATLVNGGVGSPTAWGGNLN